MNTFKLSSKEDCKALKWVQSATSKDREALKGFLVDGDSTVAADGFRMHVIPTPEPLHDSIGVQGKIIKPNNTIGITPRIEEYEVIDARFPQWEEIVPSDEPVFRIRINKNYLAALKDMPTDNESLLLEFTDSKHPVKVTGSEGCTAVIMPMKLD